MVVADQVTGFYLVQVDHRTVLRLFFVLWLVGFGLEVIVDHLLYCVLIFGVGEVGIEVAVGGISHWVR